jgi:fungalysin metallopeptidase (M36)/thrombospondin type 3 repeat protein
VAAVALGGAAFAAPASGRGFSARVANDLQGAHAPVSQLERTSLRHSFGTTFVQVRQEIQGIPVLGATASISLSGAGGDLLLDHTRVHVARPPAARVSKAAAEATARRAGRVRGLRAPIQAGLALLGNRLVWRVVIPSANPPADLEVLVDARTGSVVRLRDLARHALGDALAFDPNPIVEQGSRAGLADDGNKDSASLDALYRHVTLRDVDPGAGCLSGAWVNTVLSRNTVAGRAAFCPNTAHDFGSVTRGDPCGCFEMAMAYFHIDRMQRYLQGLGFNNVVHRAITVNLHAVIADNSFYSGSTGTLNFGDGGVNDAQDADVIDHEYGHAIQDSQAAGFGVTNEGGAIGEGWGDYWEAAQSANQGASDEFNACFAEWDTSAVPAFSAVPIPCLRRVDLQWTLPEARGNCANEEIHCVGQAWSSLLWTIRKTLGGTAADRLIVQSQFSYAPTSGFADAARALLFADRQLNGGANKAFLTSLLVGRGFVTDEELDDEPTGAQALAVPARVSGHVGLGSDDRDVYAVQLRKGHGVVLRVVPSGGLFLELAVFPPGTNRIENATAVRGPSRDKTLAYLPPADGTYFLSVRALSGAGDYTVDTQVDADADGVPDASDNCPAAANRRQEDWNKNGRGDSCDRSSKTTIDRITVRGHALTVAGSIRPRLARPSAWLVEVRASGRLVATSRGSRGRSAGRVVAVAHVPARTHGRLTVRAVLKDPRYKRATSRTASVSVR